VAVVVKVKMCAAHTAMIGSITVWHGEKNDLNDLKSSVNKDNLTTINPRVPTILQHSYMVNHGVLKIDTIPVPVLPILETLHVSLYPFWTPAAFNIHYAICAEGGGRLQRPSERLETHPWWAGSQRSGNFDDLDISVGKLGWVI
jgi:hypothetical protein